MLLHVLFHSSNSFVNCSVRGIDLNQTLDDRANTALHLAADRGNFLLAYVLIMVTEPSELSLFYVYLFSSLLHQILKLKKQKHNVELLPQSKLLSPLFPVAME